MNDNLTETQHWLLQAVEYHELVHQAGTFRHPGGDFNADSQTRMNLRVLEENGLVELHPDTGTWFTTDKGSETLVEWRKR